MSNQPKTSNAWLVAGALALALSAACFTSFRLIGSHVDAEGFLHEPFALIPLGWLAGLVGAVLLAIGWARRR